MPASRDSECKGACEVHGVTTATSARPRSRTTAYDETTWVQSEHLPVVLQQLARAAKWYGSLQTPQPDPAGRGVIRALASATGSGGAPEVRVKRSVSGGFVTYEKWTTCTGRLHTQSKPYIQ